jgi:hypothetical protein
VEVSHEIEFNKIKPTLQLFLAIKEFKHNKHKETRKKLQSMALLEFSLESYSN